MKLDIQKIYAFILCLVFVLSAMAAPVFAEEETDLETLGMFYETDDLVASVTRNPTPISQTAENVTIVTAEQISMMGAHTLADVLNNIPGIQTNDRGSVGTYSSVTIQGASDSHVLFLLDGVRLNFLSSAAADIANVPLQHIDRIEIVKGPGSSSWGSALGGVVSIVTKSPTEKKTLGATLSLSAGERSTRDSRGEISGTTGRLGYYLYAGNFTSDGFRPETATDHNNVYGKLRWEVPEKGSLVYTVAYTRSSSGAGTIAPFNVKIGSHQRYFLSTLTLKYQLRPSLLTDVSLRGTSTTAESTAATLNTGEVLNLNVEKETNYGGSAKLTWQEGNNALTVGGDFDHGRSHDDATQFWIDPNTGMLTSSAFLQTFRTDRWGVFLNDTITLGEFTLTPSIRYDRTPQTGDFTSPSLGIAWAPREDTILRVYAGRGFSLPVIQPGAVQEKVITVQAGLETTLVPYLWLKTTLFRNDLHDIQAHDAAFNLISLKRLKQGVEVEAKTIPIVKMALSAGYTFIDTTDGDTGKIIPDTPRHIAKFGLHYDNSSWFRGALLGRYVFWNASPASGAKDTAIIWDLNLEKQVMNYRGTTLQLFMSGHNIFNGAQYSLVYFPNSRRWLEGGLRLSF